jgi:uncharacterized protein (DUF362 family)
MARRFFLRRLVRVLLGAAGAGSLGYLFYDSKGPGPFRPHVSTAELGGFAVDATAGRMAVARGRERRQLLKAAVTAIGGMSAFVSRGDHVLLKVNAAFASPPAIGATTHPDLVTAAVELCREAGAARVLVTDNPIHDPASCFALSGIDRAAREAGAEVLLPQLQHFRSYSLPGGRLLRNWPVLLAPFEGVTKLIGLAPVKDHNRSGASLTMKNWYGLLGGRRNLFHQDIHEIIKELALMARPTLVILDGSTSMVANGPTGGSLSDLKATATLVASTDQVAADAFGVSLLGKERDQPAFIRKAEAAGAGQADYRNLPFFKQVTV